MNLKKKMLTLGFLLYLLLSLLLFNGFVSKKTKVDPNYPQKPVEILVGFSAGGGTDACARLVFQYAEKYFGQKFVIVNKLGAAGEIAWTELSRAKPDGYIIGFINPPTFVSHPVQRESCKYKIDDFKIIANTVSDPACIVVKKDSPMNTVVELYELAETKDVSIGYSGPGTSESLMLRQIEDITGKNLDKIPYDGSAPSVVALLGGHIDAVCMNVSEAVNYTSEGSLKLIGVSSKDRIREFPDISTLKEQGIEVFNEGYRGVAAPAAMPDEYVAKIEEAIKKALDDPEFIYKAKTQNLPLNYLDSERFTKIILDIENNLKAETAKGEW